MQSSEPAGGQPDSRPPKRHAKFDVFLCHNDKDKPLLEDLNQRLRQEFGIRTFLDESAIVGGSEWEKVIRAALASSRTCAIILGEH